MTNLFFFALGYVGCILTIVGADAVYRLWLKVKHVRARRISNLKNIRQTMSINPKELESSVGVRGRALISDGSV